MTAKRAIIFDFDRTLTPGSMFDVMLDAWGIGQQKFFDSCIPLQEGENAFDAEHSYLYRLVEAGKKELRHRLDDTRLRVWGRTVILYPGLVRDGDRSSIFQRLFNLNTNVFIVSGGLQPVIEGCLHRNALSGFVTKVFASRMAEEEMNDGYGNRLSFPKEVVNSTLKTQKLFAIKKGSWRPENRFSVHEKIAADQKEFDFSNMCYVGDGWSDEAAFALVNKFGGYTVGVYDHHRKGSYEYMLELLNAGRVQIIFEADYRYESSLSEILEHWAGGAS